MKRVLLSSDPEATEALGEAVGRAAGAGTVVTLDGDLGAGKTTFVRGLARGLGIDDAVASPTYTLMQAHEESCYYAHLSELAETRRSNLD